MTVRDVDGNIFRRKACSLDFVDKFEFFRFNANTNGCEQAFFLHVFDEV